MEQRSSKPQIRDLTADELQAVGGGRFGTIRPRSFSFAIRRLVNFVVAEAAERGASRSAERSFERDDD